MLIYILNTLAIILFILWVIGYFVLDGGSLIHITLAIGLLMVSYIIVRANK
ncbi:MAG: lmo0937 family membrane protein [Bacteroidetes bacterium]|nr:lmo0937 family membrane protein [Bacteroidota bacterium]